MTPFWFLDNLLMSSNGWPDLSSIPPELSNASSAFFSSTPSSFLAIAVAVCVGLAVAGGAQRNISRADQRAPAMGDAFGMARSIAGVLAERNSHLGCRAGRMADLAQVLLDPRDGAIRRRHAGYASHRWSFCVKYPATARNYTCNFL